MTLGSGIAIPLVQAFNKLNKSAATYLPLSGKGPINSVTGIKIAIPGPTKGYVDHAVAKHLVAYLHLNTRRLSLVLKHYLLLHIALTNQASSSVTAMSFIIYTLRSHKHENVYIYILRCWICTVASWHCFVLTVPGFWSC